MIVQMKSIKVTLCQGARKLLCLVGKHDWKVYPAIYRTALDVRLGIAQVPSRRTCRCCKKKQQEMLQCLGLNPPRYYSQWFNL